MQQLRRPLPIQTIAGRPSQLAAQRASTIFAAANVMRKYPRTIWFSDELPKGPTGKILKREIKPM